MPPPERHQWIRRSGPARRMVAPCGARRRLADHGRRRRLTNQMALPLNDLTITTSDIAGNGASVQDGTNDIHNRL